MIILEIRDTSDRDIHLTQEQWKHIRKEHPTVTDLDEVKETLLHPLAVRPSKYDPDFVRWYYRFNKKRKRYMLVSVKYLNGEGFIITAYYTRNLR